MDVKIGDKVRIRIFTRDEYDGIVHSKGHATPWGDMIVVSDSFGHFGWDCNGVVPERNGRYVKDQEIVNVYPRRAQLEMDF